MKPGLKAKWIEALRGGNYQQGRNYLRRTNNKCCCLGVLCDLTMPNKWERTRRVWAIDGIVTWPSTSMVEEWGMTEPQIHYLARRNDNGASFAQIADWIERNV